MATFDATGMKIGSVQQNWVWWVTCAFIVAVCVGLLFEFYFILALPLALTVLWVMFYRPKWLLLFIVFATPFSLNLEELQLGGVAFYLPTEPLLLGMTILLVIAHLLQPVFSHQIWQHPVSQIFAVLMLWTLCTSFTSSQPIVSLKFLIARLWFLIPVYFFGASLFLKERNTRSFINSFLFALAAVVLITTIKHQSNGFDEQSAHWIMEPFFRDHTQYGAVVAIFIPVVLVFLFESDRNWISRISLLVILSLLTLALIFTYSRAAWLSVVAALGIWALAKLRIRVGWIMVASAIVLGAIVLSFDQIVMELRKNRTDSSDNLVENVESITNISTDASNLERLNRWNAVFGMAKDRPLFGFGPGTYMFEYAPYQDSRDLTIISTNFGDVGNAHSEFLGPLAEMGIPGLLLTLALVVAFFYHARLTWLRLPRGPSRDTVLACSLGLVTYFAHGTLNNFLDADKASVPVYMLMAIVVAVDVASRSKSH